MRLQKIDILTLFIVSIIGCSTLSPATAFQKVEAVPGLTQAELAFKNSYDQPIVVKLRGDLNKDIPMEPFSSTNLEVSPGSYSITATCSDAMPVTLYIKAEKEHRYLLNFYTGAK